MYEILHLQRYRTRSPERGEGLKEQVRKGREAVSLEGLVRDGCLFHTAFPRWRDLQRGVYVEPHAEHHALWSCGPQPRLGQMAAVRDFVGTFRNLSV